MKLDDLRKQLSQKKPDPKPDPKPAPEQKTFESKVVDEEPWDKEVLWDSTEALTPPKKPCPKCGAETKKHHADSNGPRRICSRRTCRKVFYEEELDQLIADHADKKKGWFPWSKKKRERKETREHTIPMCDFPGCNLPATEGYRDGTNRCSGHPK